MNSSAALWRCFWREYRCGRSFWLAILVLTLCMQLAWHFGNRLGQWGASPLPLQAMSLIMPLVYVLAWAATSFNREHETDIFSRLQELPLTFVPLWLAKLAFTLASGWLLAAVVMLVAIWLGGISEGDPLRVPFSRWFMWFIAAAGIGSVCSQWIKRPLAAVFAAGGVFLAVALWPTNEGMSFGAHIHRLNQSLLLVLGPAAFVVSLPQTRPWLEDRMTMTHGFSTLSLAGTAAAAASIGSRRRTQLGRHLWVSWRRLGLAASIVLATMLLCIRWASESDSSFSGVIGLQFLFAWPWLLGATLFYCEQDAAHARFLAAHGVSPDRVWWLRQLIGGVLFLACCTGLFVMMFPQFADLRSESDYKIVRAYMAYAVLAYLFSQFISITLRSRLVGLALAALLAALSAGWAQLVMKAGVPVWIGLILPAATLLIASRLRAAPFLLEWNNVRHWWAPATVLVAGLLASVAAVVAFRATEIPRVAPPVDIAAFTASADANFNAQAAERILATASALSSHVWPAPARYSGVTTVNEQTAIAVADQATDWRALPLPIPHEEQRALANAQELLTPELEQALASAHGLFPSRRWSWSNYDDAQHVVRLGQLFVMRARQRTKDDELDAAGEDYRHALRVGSQLRRFGSVESWWTSYQLEKLVADNLIFWAAAPGQDAGRVTAMIDWLVARQQDETSWLTPLYVNYVMETRFVDGLPESLADRSSYLARTDQVGVLAFLSSLPGERTRLRRLVDARTSFASDRLTQAVGHQMEGMIYAIEDDAQHRWSETTPLAFLIRPAGQSLVINLAQQEWQRVALLARLALIRMYLTTGIYLISDFSSGQLPRDIADQLQTMFRSTNWEKIPALADWKLSKLVKYSQVPEVPLHVSLMRYDEPLGHVIVNVAGRPAIVVGSVVYPLPPVPWRAGPR